MFACKEVSAVLAPLAMIDTSPTVLTGLGKQIASKLVLYSANVNYAMNSMPSYPAQRL